MLVVVFALVGVTGIGWDGCCASTRTIGVVRVSADLVAAKNVDRGGGLPTHGSRANGSSPDRGHLFGIGGRRGWR